MKRLNLMFKKMQSKLNEDKGATMVEYALMVVGIALAAVATMRTVGTELSGVFFTIASNF